MRARKRRFYRQRHRERLAFHRRELIQCWCGAVGTVEELFDFAVYDRRCGGSQILDCDCGGDFCVCHHHGEVECPGCPDCLNEDDDWDDYDADEYYDDEAYVV